jgi:anaerobic magnesium-protoporphyrin IX monomethyl ester cyclase
MPIFALKIMELIMSGRKKVVLYNPEAVFFDMPLALLSVGSVLDAEQYEVIVLDARIDPDAHRKVLELAPQALVFGVTALTGRPLRDALSISRKVKKTCPDLPVVWGGWHPSLFPVEILEEEKSVDITVQAQGEETFRELVEHINIGAPLDSVAGIAFRKTDGTVQQNPGRALLNMNFLPRVNYDFVPVEQYFKAKKRRQFDYISSAGCRFRCTFFRENGRQSSRKGWGRNWGIGTPNTALRT